LVKEALTALSVLAASLKGEFTKFYDSMVPLMSSML
jgi:hypothetical protein